MKTQKKISLSNTREVLELLYRLSEQEALKLAAAFLKGKYEKIEVTNEYIMAEGNLPICLVAHLDTVWETDPPTQFFYDAESEVLFSGVGLGADDRNGLYAILALVSRGYRPHIVLTTSEERGGKGAAAVIRDYPECPFKELKAIIEIDRQGVDEMVFYQCDNKDFERYMKQFGFNTERGTFTDISIIAPAWDVAAVNVSAAYYNEHTCGEICFIKSLRNIINAIGRILDRAVKMPAFKYIPAISMDYYSVGYNRYGHGYRYDDTPKDYVDECFMCGAKIKTFSDRRVMFNSGTKFVFCKKCYDDYDIGNDIRI